MERREQQWIEPLISAYSRPAFQLAAALVKNRAIAEEIVQEAFLRAMTGARTPREMVEFRRWLYRIILNLAREHGRRSRRWFHIRLVEEPPIDPEAQAQQRLGDAEMMNALRILSPRERDAIYLRFFEDAAYEDLAAIMQISESTARVLVHRGLEKLRERLGRQAKRDTA
jgi:RNA polymerase sigma-70 factor (ECF subfamily)